MLPAFYYLHSTMKIPIWHKSIFFCASILIALCSHLPVYSQNNSSTPDYWKVQHISTESGLSNRFINYITQDSRGFTWIGTNFGLNRYDGHRVDVLTRESH